MRSPIALAGRARRDRSVSLGCGGRQTHGNSVVADYTALLDAGAFLGARFVSVWAGDSDRSRLGESLYELAEMAAPLGIKVLVEPMVYNALPSVDVAAAMLDAVGHPNLGMIIDALHFFRAGQSPSDVRTLAPGAIALLQL